MLLLTTLAFAATMVARLVISPVVPEITAAFDVSTASVGLVLTGMWAAYALFQFPSGLLSERIGERRTILAAVGLTAAASALLAAAPTFSTFALTALALGAGAGLHYSVATTLLAGHFEDIGRAIGVHVAGGPAAGLVAPVAAAAVATRYGWRVAVLLGTLVAVPVFVLFARRVRPTPPARGDSSTGEPSRLASASRLLVRPPIAFTMLLAIGGAFTWQATASFLPAFLIEAHGFTPAAAGLAFSAYFVVHGLTQPLTGRLSDRFGRDAVAGLVMGCGVLGYGLLAFGGGSWVLGAIPLIGLAMSWGAPVQSRFIDNLEPDERSSGFGLVRTVYMLLGALGSAVVGGLAAALGWTAAFGLLGAVMAVEVTLIAGNRLFRIGM